MFCSNCGKEVAEGMRFCTNCGTPVAAQSQAPAPQATQYTPPVAGVSGGNSTLLLDYKFESGVGDMNFEYFGADGKRISADKLFNRGTAAVVSNLAYALLSSPLSPNPGFAIKAEIYDNKICFNRLTMLGLGKPSGDRFEIYGSEIASVEMSNKLHKTITVVTHSSGKLTFLAPKKHIEHIAQIINSMISQSKS